LGLRLARNRNIPHVASLHTDYERYAHYIPGLRPLDRVTGIVAQMAKVFYNEADVVVVPSVAAKNLAARYEISRPLHVVPTAIEITRLDSSPASTEYWPAGKRRLLTVSRIGREKEIDVVLRAVWHIARSVDVHLVLVGSGPDERRVRATIRKLGIDNRVTVVTPVSYDCIGSYYLGCELFLFASSSETQGLVVGEAQALGVPVVAVGAGGVREAVVHGRTGYLVPPKRDDLLAEKALALLKDEGLREEFSAEARLLNQGVTTQMTSAIMDVYAEAIRRKPPRATN
jgi:glycosyltransferase involved in cell wall biosynthesis